MDVHVYVNVEFTYTYMYILVHIIVKRAPTSTVSIVMAQEMKDIPTYDDQICVCRGKSRLQ